MRDEEQKQGKDEKTTRVGIQIVPPSDEFYEWVKRTVQAGITYAISHTELDGQLLMDEETSIQPRGRENYAVGARIRLSPGTFARYQGLNNLPDILAALGIKGIQKDNGGYSWRGMGNTGIDFQLRFYGSEDVISQPNVSKYETIELTLGKIYNPIMLSGAINAFPPTYEKVLEGIYQAAHVPPPNKTITFLPTQPVSI